MGQDKALLPFLGQALILRVMERVRPLADELLVTTNHAENYGFLRVPLVSDLLPGRGALGGLYTALSAAHHPLVAVVACDMPFVNPALLAAARDRLVETDFDAVIPEDEHGTEPFHAVYRPATCLPAIAAALNADRWKVNAWFPDVRISFITLSEIRTFDPLGLAFWNVNTPEELDQAQVLAQQIDPAGATS